MARRSINVGNKIERVWEWLFPTVVIALAPVVAEALVGKPNEGSYSYGYTSFEKVISPNGELLLVAVALVAESVSEIWRRQIPRWQKNSIGSLSIGFVIVSTFVYSGLTGDPTVASLLSFEMFAWGFMLCIACKVAGRS